MERGTRRTSLTWYLSRSRCLVKDRGAHKRWQAGQVVDSSLRGEAGAGGGVSAITGHSPTGGPDAAVGGEVTRRRQDGDAAVHLARG